VDEINTVPFQAHKVVKATKLVALIHQLAREVWFSETRFPINALGYYLFEPHWLKGYRRIRVATVSNSTKRDLLERGFQHVEVIYSGLRFTPLNRLPEKEDHLTLAFLGRLVRHKRPNDAVIAFRHFKALFPESRLWIIGDGYLRDQMERSHVEGVSFFGNVSDVEKLHLLERAHMLLVPSVREGWGLVAIEANSRGTPSIAYDVPGLRDSIVNGETGVLVQPNPIALGEAASCLARDPDRLRELSVNALEWSKRFSWARTASDFRSFLEASLLARNKTTRGM